MTYQEMQQTFCLMVIDPDAERVQRTGKAKNWLSEVQAYKGTMPPYLDTDAMPTLIVFRRSLELELGFATLIHVNYSRIHMITEIYFPPVFGIMDDNGVWDNG